MDNTKQLVVRLLLAGVSLIVTLILLEIGLRLWFDTQGSELDRIRYRYDRATINRHTAQLIGVPYLNYTLNPAWDDINPRGIRGDLVAVPKPAGVFRILALGGSTTFGHDLSAEEAWPAQLQRILRDDYGYTNVEVINLGVPGYYSLDSVVSLATRGLALEPDLVISYDGLNDAVIRMYQDPACYNSDTPLFGFGMDRGLWRIHPAELPASTLYRFVAIQLGWLDDPTMLESQFEPTGWCPPEPGTSPLDLLAQNPPMHVARNLRSSAALARSGGAQIMFSTVAWDTAAADAVLAADPGADGTRALWQGIAEHNALVTELAATEGALFIDLADLIGPGPYFQGDQVHQTAEGCARQAALYALYLTTDGVIPPPTAQGTP